ncbi:MAG TPA: hypothetical protein VJ549_02390 [Geothrix sp.]|nr:hypothetical protein [Geothrix sp.]
MTLCLSGNGIENWQGVDITIQSITLTPKSGGPPVALFTAPAPGLPVNLALLDHTDQLVGNFPIPLGTYTSATLNLVTDRSAVQIRPSENPALGFPGVDSPMNYDSAFVLGQNSSTSPSVVTCTVALPAPLMVTTDQGHVLDLAFDSFKPTFLLDHGTPSRNVWSMDFDGVLSQRPIQDPSQLALNPIAGMVTDTDGGSIFIAQRFTGEGLPSVSVPQRLRVHPDAASGTLCWDLASDTNRLVKDFAFLAGVSPNSPITVAGRLQSDGSLVASRLWIGEGSVVGDLIDGHMLFTLVNSNNLQLEGETRDGVAIHGIGGWNTTIDTQTQFFLRNPANPRAETTPIGVGPTFLSSNKLAKGFRVFVYSHWTGRSFVARSVDILAARFSGAPSQATGSQFTCTTPKGTNLGDSSDQVQVLPFATGFTWSNDLGPSTGADFAGFATRTVDFGGTAGAYGPWSTTEAVWGDPANPVGWSARDTGFQSLRLPDGSVAAPWVASANGGTFDLALPGGTQTVTVNVNVASTLAYHNHGINTYLGGFSIGLEAFDLTAPTGLTTFLAYLAHGYPVRVFGYPNGSGGLVATTIFIQDPN